MINMIRIHKIMHTIQDITAYEQDIYEQLNAFHELSLYHQPALAFHCISFVKQVVLSTNLFCIL